MRPAILRRATSRTPSKRVSASRMAIPSKPGWVWTMIRIGGDFKTLARRHAGPGTCFDAHVADRRLANRRVAARDPARRRFERQTLTSFEDRSLGGRFSEGRSFCPGPLLCDPCCGDSRCGDSGPATPWAGSLCAGNPFSEDSLCGDPLSPGAFEPAVCGLRSRPFGNSFFDVAHGHPCQRWSAYGVVDIERISQSRQASGLFPPTRHSRKKDDRLKPRPTDYLVRAMYSWVSVLIVIVSPSTTKCGT